MSKNFGINKNDSTKMDSEIEKERKEVKNMIEKVGSKSASSVAASAARSSTLASVSSRDNSSPCSIKTGVFLDILNAEINAMCAKSCDSEQKLQPGLKNIHSNLKQIIDQLAQCLNTEQLMPGILKIKQAQQ